MRDSLWAVAVVEDHSDKGLLSFFSFLNNMKPKNNADLDPMDSLPEFVQVGP